MRNGSVDTGVLVWGDRYMPASVVVDQARAIQASGVADWLVMSDQLVNFIPPQLWQPDVTPMAEVLPDADSLADPWTLISYAAAAVPGLGLSVLTDQPASLIPPSRRARSSVVARAAWVPVRPKRVDPVPQDGTELARLWPTGTPDRHGSANRYPDTAVVRTADLSALKT